MSDLATIGSPDVARLLDEEGWHQQAAVQRLSPGEAVMIIDYLIGRAPGLLNEAWALMLEPPRTKAQLPAPAGNAADVDLAPESTKRHLSASRSLTGTKGGH